MFDYENLLTTITAVTAIIGIFGLWYQIKKSRDLAEGQFVLNLNTTFAENKDIQEIYRKLEQYRQGNRDVFSEQNDSQIAEYLSFFGNIYNLLDKKVLNFKTIDSFFPLRFFLIINNPYVQKYLMEDEEHYRVLLILYKKWLKYRKNHKRNEPFSENSFSIILGRKKYPSNT